MPEPVNGHAFLFVAAVAGAAAAAASIICSHLVCFTMKYDVSRVSQCLNDFRALQAEGEQRNGREEKR